MEIVINYILPNAVMFGGIYAMAKLFEQATWYFICNYNDIVNKLT